MGALPSALTPWAENRIALSLDRFADALATVAWAPKTVGPRRFDVIDALIESVADEIGIPAGPILSAGSYRIGPLVSLNPYMLNRMRMVFQTRSKLAMLISNTLRRLRFPEDSRLQLA